METTFLQKLSFTLTNINVAMGMMLMLIFGPDASGLQLWIITILSCCIVMLYLIVFYEFFTQRKSEKRAKSQQEVTSAWIRREVEREFGYQAKRWKLSQPE